MVYTTGVKELSSTTVTENGLPPMMLKRYQYQDSAPHLDPTGSAENPHFCIKAVK
jgi:hypothetical protein